MKESKEELLTDLFKFFSIAFLFAGVVGMLLSIDSFMLSVKPGMDFEYVLDYPVKPGMHIEGQVLYSYGCFAEQTTMSVAYGRKTGEKSSGYYYAIPGVGGVVILKLPTYYNSAMETLTEETFAYLSGGASPKTVVQIDGYVARNQSESLQRMLGEYLELCGYTRQEIENMGEIYMIVQGDSLSDMRNLFIGSLAVLLAGLIMTVIRQRERIATFFGKNLRNLSPEEEARLGNMLTQVSMDKGQIAKRMAMCMLLGIAVATAFSYQKFSLGYLAGSVIFAYAAAILFGLLPLINSRTYIIFYENGMNYCGTSFLYEESGYPEFQVVQRAKGRVSVFLKLKNRWFDVTYMKDFMQEYKRAYGI